MDAEGAKKAYRIGDWDVRPSELRISNSDQEHALEAKVMEVLQVLIDNHGDVVLREHILDRVWGIEFGGDESLTRAISLLRKCFGDERGKQEYIRTVPRKGYQLIADVSETAATLRSGTATTTTQLPESQSSVRSRGSLFTLVAAALILIAAIINFGKDFIFPTGSELPLVMIMDSAHPARIYDESVRESGGTNADILSDVFSDLPIRTQKELISPNWHRHEAIMKFDPDLIVIHYSGFKQEDASGPRPKLKLLIEYFEELDTEFLVYSRASKAWLSEKVNLVVEDLYADNPDLRERIEIFPLVECGDPNWMNQTCAQGIKLAVKHILALD